MISIGNKKPWVELTADEKTERMRKEVWALQRRCQNLDRKLFEVTQLLEKHEHSDRDGKPLTSVRAFSGCGGQEAKVGVEPGQEYF